MIRLTVETAPFEGGRGWKPGDLIDVYDGPVLSVPGKRVVLAVRLPEGWDLYVM